MTKLPRVMANVPKELYEALKKRVKKEKMSMSKFIVKLLKASLLLLMLSMSACKRDPGGNGSTSLITGTTPVLSTTTVPNPIAPPCTISTQCTTDYKFCWQVCN
jgi:hypothetical protein